MKPWKGVINIPEGQNIDVMYAKAYAYIQRYGRYPNHFKGISYV